MNITWIKKLTSSCSITPPPLTLSVCVGVLVSGCMWACIYVYRNIRAVPWGMFPPVPACLRACVPACVLDATCKGEIINLHHPHSSHNRYPSSVTLLGQSQILTRHFGKFKEYTFPVKCPINYDLYFGRTMSQYSGYLVYTIHIMSVNTIRWVYLCVCVYVCVSGCGYTFVWF